MLNVCLSIMLGSTVAFGAEAWGSYRGSIETPLPLQNALADAEQSEGAVLAVAGLNVLAAPKLPQVYTDSPGLDVFCDAPEYPVSAGILYKDTLHAGRARLYQYQVNGASGDVAISFPIVLSNPGVTGVKVTEEALGVAGPSRDYQTVGIEASLKLLGPQTSRTFIVPAGKAVVLDPEHAKLKAASGELINGIFDVALSGPLEVYFLAVKSGTDPLGAYQALPILPNLGTHDRGTFTPCNREITMPEGITYDTANGIYQITLGGNTPNDPNVQGVDATNGTTVNLRGNFGVLYHFLLRVRSTDGRHVAILISPIGGYHASVVDMPPGVTPGGVFAVAVPVPSVAAGVLGRFAPSKEGKTISFFWMTAGASNLPVQMLLVPYMP